MITSDQRMIAKQAEIITSLNNQIKQMEERHNIELSRLENIHNHGVMYKQMQEAIIVNPALQEAWNDFVIVMKLSDTNIEENIKTELEKSKFDLNIRYHV